MNTPHIKLISMILIILAISLLFLTPVLYKTFINNDYYGLDISQKAPVFSLKNTGDNLVSLDDYRGKFVYLMFGYLGCEKVCHSQTFLFYSLNQRIQSDKIQFLYIGMDPNNDNAELIKTYFDQRGTNFSGLIAKDRRQAQQIASDYHAPFSFVPDKSEYFERINHPGFIYLIDPNGWLRLLYSGSNLNIDLMINDLLKIKKSKFAL